MSDIIAAPSAPPTDAVPINAWSFSRLNEFERCKLRAKLLFLDKIPEPERPLPPGKTEQANDRGTRLHKAAEDYVSLSHDVDLIPELSDFREEFTRVRELFREGKASVEGQWAFDESWAPCDWFAPIAWVRLAIDLRVQLSDTHMLVVDYKSGRKSGNEVKHSEQMALYQLATFLRYPDVETVTAELWYVDKNDLSRQVYTRERGMKYLATFNKRGLAMTQCEEFPPNPSDYTCRFCYYGAKGSGVCPVGR